MNELLNTVLTALNTQLSALVAGGASRSNRGNISLTLDAGNTLFRPDVIYARVKFSDLRLRHTPFYHWERDVVLRREDLVVLSTGNVPAKSCPL